MHIDDSFIEFTYFLVWPLPETATGVLCTYGNETKVRKMEHQLHRARCCSLLLLLHGSLRVCVCALYALWQSCEECQSMRPKSAVQCVRRSAVDVRVVR